MQISIDHVCKRYGSAPALDDVTLRIDAGQIIALLGANGAGKSTLLRALAAIAALDRGEIRYDGELLRRDRLDLRRRFGMLPDFPKVLLNTTVLRHIGMVVHLYEAECAGLAERIVQLLDDFDLLPLSECVVGTLSRGEAYKVSLVALLAVDPELWMFDEPFASGMDPHGLASFRRHAGEAVARGRTVIYSTQILEVAEKFADRVCIMDRGRIVAFDTLAALHGPSTTSDGVLQAMFARLHEESP